VGALGGKQGEGGGSERVGVGGARGCAAEASRLLTDRPTSRSTRRSDADIDLAAKAVLKGGFSYSGQRCTAVKLVLVMKDVADALAAKVGRWGVRLLLGSGRASGCRLSYTAVLRAAAQPQHYWGSSTRSNIACSSMWAPSPHPPARPPYPTRTTPLTPRLPRQRQRATGGGRC